MPPKKKGGKSAGKKGKKGKKSSKSSSAGEPRAIGRADVGEKAFFSVQLDDLNRRIASFQRKCDELELKSGKIYDEFKQIQVDRDQMVAYLKAALEERGEELTALNDQYVRTQQQKEQEKEGFEARMQEARNELAETRETLLSENVLLNARLSSLDDFKYKKDELMTNLTRMEEELARQKKEQQDTLYDLERKAVVEKDRLKKEMLTKVNELSTEFRKVSNQQMAETTKRTIHENVEINAKLIKMSARTMELIEINDRLKALDKKQRQHIELLDFNEKEFDRKNQASLKTIRLLTEKCRSYEEVLEDVSARAADHRDMDSERRLLQQQTDSQREELSTLEKEAEQYEADVQRIRSERRQAEGRRQKTEELLSRLAQAVRMVIDADFDWDGGPELSDAEKRDSMLEHMLMTLNLAAVRGFGIWPTAADKAAAAAATSTDSRLDLSRLPSRGASRLGAAASPASLMPTSLLLPAAARPEASPYGQLGDLGLVPRQPPSMAAIVERRAMALSATTRLGTLRRVLTKSVGVQTVDSSKTVFFADHLLSHASLSQQQAIIKDFHSREQMAKPFLAKVI